MTILHVITRLILGGAQQNTVLSCRAQAEAGYRVWLAYGPIYGPEGSLLEEARASGAELVEIAALRRAVLPADDMLACAALRRLVRRVDPDVVHTHSSKAGVLGRAAAWRGPRARPAVVHTVHGLPFHDRQSRAVRRTFVVAERWAARRCHRIIGITEAMCDAFRHEGIGRPEQYAVVPSGVDCTRFSDPQVACGAETDAEVRRAVRAELGIAEAAPVVGMVARFDPLKGHADLLNVAPRWFESHPDLRIVFVGDGFHRREVEQQIRDAGLADRVILTGRVPLARIPYLLRAMDIVALPSYQEGQSRVLAEALLCGCGIVAYDAGGIREVCLDDRTGRLVECGDRAALGEAVGGLLVRPEQRRRLAEAGRRHVEANFSLEAMVAGLERVYADALAQTGIT